MLEAMAHPGFTFVLGLLLGISATLLVPWLWRHARHKWLWLLVLFTSLFGVARFGHFPFATAVDKDVLAALDVVFVALFAGFGFWSLVQVLTKLPPKSEKSPGHIEKLARCVACRKEISKRANICPYCNQPDPTNPPESATQLPKQVKPA